MENIAVGVIMRVGIHETDIGIAMDSASGVEILPCGLGLDFIHLADGACHRAVEFVIEIYLLVGLCLRRKKGYVVIPDNDESELGICPVSGETAGHILAIVAPDADIA